MPVRPLLSPMAVVAAAGLALAACATPQTPGSPAPVPPRPGTTEEPGVSHLAPAGYDGRFAGVFTVLESPSHGPQLCYAVAESYPPQCGGPDIVGWDWAAVEEESYNGTTWGSYLMIGTWDAGTRTFTLTEPARNSDEMTDWEPPQGLDPDFTSPCPEPAGGWRPVDPATATEDTLQRATALAEAEPDFAGSWIDQSYLAENGFDEGEANDPRRFVLNMRFTGDLARHETEIRAVWGGALCVSLATHTQRQLEAIRQEAGDDTDRLGSSIDVVTGTVWITVMVAAADRQAELDARYGQGVVRLSGMLRPID